MSLKRRNLSVGHARLAEIRQLTLDRRIILVHEVTLYELDGQGGLSDATASCRRPVSTVSQSPVLGSWLALPTTTNLYSLKKELFDMVVVVG